MYILQCNLMLRTIVYSTSMMVILYILQVPVRTQAQRDFFNPITNIWAGASH